jgi:hypothetical protein
MRLKGSTLGYIAAVLYAMFVFAFAALLAAIAPPAHAAGCIDNWPWQQPTSAGKKQQWEHKALHAVGEGAITYGVAYETENVWWGVAAGGLVGAAREIQKAKTPGMRCEKSSITFNLIGIGLGGWGYDYRHHWFVAPIPGGAALVYSAPLN